MGETARRGLLRGQWAATPERRAPAARGGGGAALTKCGGRSRLDTGAADGLGRRGRTVRWKPPEPAPPRLPHSNAPGPSHSIWKPQAGRSARDTLNAVLKLWTSDAARLTQGEPALADTEPELALATCASHRHRGAGTCRVRPGRAGAPAARNRCPICPPSAPTDWNRPGAGVIWLLQICALTIPSSIAHACRVLLKNVRSMTRQRWRQSGFRNAHGSDRPGGSMRNLMGQVDGTANLHDEEAFDRHVWDDRATSAVVRLWHRPRRPADPRGNGHVGRTRPCE